MHILAGITFDPPMNCLPQSQLFEDMHIFCSSSTSSFFPQRTLLVLFISFCFSSISECLIKHWQFSLFLLPSQLLYFFSLTLFHSSLSPLSLYLKMSYFKSWESLAQSLECHGMFWKIRLSAFCKSLAQRTTLPALHPIIPPSKV